MDSNKCENLYVGCNANKNIYTVIVCIGFLQEIFLSMNAFNIKLSNTLTLIIEF